MKKKLFFALALLPLILAACTSAPLQNGENYSCSDHFGYLDVLTDFNDPNREARFSCAYPSFDVTFSLPMDACLFNAIRAHSGEAFLGVVLRNGEIVQLYRNDQHNFTLGIVNYWDVDSDC